MKNGRNTDDRVVRKGWPPHAYAGLNIARLLSTDVSRAESKVSRTESYFSIKNIGSLK